MFHRLFFNYTIEEEEEEDEEGFQISSKKPNPWWQCYKLEKFKGLSSCGIPFSVSASRLRNGENNNFFLESSPFCGWGLLCEDYCVVDVLSD